MTHVLELARLQPASLSQKYRFYDKYRALLKAFSDDELYREAKRLYVREYFLGRELAKAEICFVECALRNESICTKARKDADFVILMIEDYMKELKVVDFKRIDFMNKDEINALFQKIGASPVFPNLTEGSSDPISLFDVIGITTDNLVVCTVAGASMEGKIEDGDIIFVDASEKPKHNDVVIADIDGNILVKRYVVKDNEIVLQSDNPAFSPIRVLTSMNFTIFGVVKRSMKKI